LSRALETIPDQFDRADAEHRGGRDGAAARAEPAKSPASEQPDTRSEKGGKPPTPPKAKQAQPQPSLLATARQHPFIVIAGALVVLLALAAALVWWLNARNYESTDDAFIDARTISISSQVNGAIVEVPVDDNQDVASGAVLARIDARDYRAAVDQAKAQIDQAVAGIANLDAQMEAQQARIDQAQKQVSGAQAALTFSAEENTRAQDLLKRGAGTEQQAQQTSSDLRQKQAALDSAQANLVAAQKQVAVLKTQREVSAGQLEQANAAKEQADANLARTVIAAPVAGRVTKLTAAKGGYAQTGQSLMMFVPREVWVTANVKETQLVDIRPGQAVDIRVDAYPGHPMQGHVESIQAGSGAAFSLLPPENATGNYVKVVQRVPVKIVFDRPPDVYLGPGMSVVPYIKVR
jgi:membrane fusion protein (multidrug efflux system)